MIGVSVARDVKAGLPLASSASSCKLEINSPRRMASVVLVESASEAVTEIGG